MIPKRAEDLVFVHSNLRLLSINSSKYKEKETSLWDIAGDDFSLDDNGILNIVSLLTYIRLKHYDILNVSFFYDEI